MKKSVIFVFYCCLSGLLFSQQARLVDVPIEQVEDVALWDQLISEKMKLLYPDKEMFVNCSSNLFSQIIQYNDVQLVDVRTEGEFKEDHIPGAILIDIRKEDFDTQVDQLLHPEKPVAVYCRGGVRSRKASEQLLLKSFRVYNLDKGFTQWKQDGMPVAKP